MKLNNKKGMSLLEVIIAVSLAAVIIATLLAAMRVSYRSQEKGIWREEISQKLRIINDRITWMLRGTYFYLISKPDGNLLYFAGQSDSIGFVTTSVDTYSQGPEDRAGLKWVQIFSDSEGLKVREKVYFSEDVFDDSGGKVYIIDPSVENIEFEYLDIDKEKQTKDWVSDWDQKEKDYLPSAVKVKIKFDYDGQKFKMPEFIVRIAAVQ